MAQRIPPTKGPGCGSSSGAGFGSGSGRGSDPGSPSGSSPEPPPERVPPHHVLPAVPVAATPVPRAPGTSAPFSWQHGCQLLLLEAECVWWVLAELRFDAARCRYVEVRRARYRWSREATGALLSRALPAGDADVSHLATDLHAWVATHRSRG